jgi:hypothetical protein
MAGGNYTKMVFGEDGARPNTGLMTGILVFKTASSNQVFWGRAGGDDLPETNRNLCCLLGLEERPGHARLRDTEPR